MHTKEPWIYELPDADHEGIIIGRHGGAVVDGEFSEANALRIVACVNACAGIPNPDDYEFAKLLRLADEQRMACLTYERENAKQAEILNSVVRQRDELKAALSAMLTHMGMDEDEWNKPTFDQARAAIGEKP